MRTQIRVLTCLVVVCMLTIGLTSIAAAQKAYPNRPIEMVVPAGAGGGLDTCSRFFVEKMKEYISVPIRVTNVSGGAHVKGIVYSYAAPADGYTIHALSPSDIMADVFGKLDFKFTEEFVPLCRVQHDTAVICVSAKSKFNSFAELVEYAKANPGKVTWGGLSPG
jgi:putative tricarboxylic transport membrane protein